MRSIDLTLGETTDAAVRAEWHTLADAGFPSLASHTGASNRPHITLAAGNELELRQHPQFDPFAVELGSVVLFARKSGFVLARSVVPTGELLDFHRRVLAHATGALDHSRPGEWMPHVTLSRRLTSDQVGAAAAILGQSLRGQVTGLRLWNSETRTVTDLVGSGAQWPERQ